MRYAVNVLGTGFRHRLISQKYPDDESRILAAHQKFRASTLQFKHVANQVRSYYDKETDTDILMKLIDTLRTDVTGVKETQEKITSNISKVIGFMKNIDLQVTGDGESDRTSFGADEDYGDEAATKATESKDKIVK